MSDAFRGGLIFSREVAATPGTYNPIGEVQSLSGLGVSNSQVDVTSFDSGNSMEYIAGMADGQEITVECNLVLSDTEQQGLLDDVDSGLTTGFQLEANDGAQTLTISFSAVCLGWVINPSNTDQHTISFTLKISGAITRAIA